MRAAGFLALLLVACETPPTTTPPPPTPPQVFLTVTESNVLGTSVKGKVNVSGCKNVTQVQLLEGGAFLADANYTKSPTDFELPASAFAALYGRRGLAASLTLSAKVVCDDGRTNTSQPVGVKFFPIHSRFSRPGNLVMPESFVAEGGLGGGATTFLGCMPTAAGGTAIARMDTRGEVTAYNEQLPENCTYDTVISDLVPSVGIRWVLQPGKVIYALDVRTLNIVKQLKGNTRRMGVGKRTGVAVVWVDELGTTQPRIEKLDPVASTANDWRAEMPGLMNAEPIVDDGNTAGAVWISSFQYMSTGAVNVGNIVPLKFDLRNGALLNGIVGGQPAVLLSQEYAQINVPIIPEGAFNADGSLYYVGLLSQDQFGIMHTTVMACATATGNCAVGSGRRWTSRTFDGVVHVIVPFAGGNSIAAIGPYQVWFLDAQSGTPQNLGEQPLRPSGSLAVLGVQPGLGTDFYVLTGPVAEGIATYPVEVIATDRAQSGELWRFDSGSGESPQAGLNAAIDEGGALWLRVGLDQVKPLSNTEYREARGPTTLP